MPRSTPLHQAVIEQDPERVAALIARGADVLAKNEHGLTALQIASPQLPIRGRDAKIDRIVDHLKAAYRRLPYQSVSLVEAAETGYSAALEHHIRIAPPAAADADVYRNAIVRAVDQGYVDATRILLEAGADPDTRDARGLTLSMIAAGKGLDEVLEVLLRRGADVNASIATRHFPNVTVLMIAAGTKKLSAVKLLVAAGATLAVRDGNGETALAYARRSGGKRVIAYLESVFERMGAHAGLTLHEAAQNGAAARARELLQQGAAVDQTDKNGATALMLAASKGHADIVQALCEAGAEVGRADAAGRNLWDYALAFDARPEVVRCLLAHGLDPNQPDMAGMPPLIRTVAFGGDNVTEVLRVLLENGADGAATFTPRVPPEMAAQAARLRALGSRLGQGISGSFTALEYAKRNRNRKAYEFLKQFSGAASDAYDAAVDDLKERTRKADAAFAQEAERIGVALNAKPQPWKKRKGVYHYFAKLPARDADRGRVRSALEQDSEASGLLGRLQAQARTQGYTLVYTETNWQGKDLTRLLLFPTAHEAACIAACGTNADNYGMGPREIVNWCAETRGSHPFTITGAGFDFMELEFSRPLANAAMLARRIAVFCPDCGIDPDDGPAIATFAQELASQGTCFFWWD
jgi:uncharacterized protein